MHADLAVVVDLQRHQEEMWMVARQQPLPQTALLPAIQLLAVCRPPPLGQFMHAEWLVMAVVRVAARAQHAASKVPERLQRHLAKRVLEFEGL
ncbi:hypothetical protein D9M69_563160 [compost metagenome]